MNDASNKVAQTKQKSKPNTRKKRKLRISDEPI